MYCSISCICTVPFPVLVLFKLCHLYFVSVQENNQCCLSIAQELLSLGLLHLSSPHPPPLLHLLSLSSSSSFLSLDTPSSPSLFLHLPLSSCSRLPLPVFSLLSWSSSSFPPLSTCPIPLRPTPLRPTPLLPSSFPPPSGTQWAGH